MLREGVKRGVPVVVGSAGGSGARPHLAWCGRSSTRSPARRSSLSSWASSTPTWTRDGEGGACAEARSAPGLRPAADGGGARRVGQPRGPDGQRAARAGPGGRLPGRAGRPLLRSGRLRRPADQAGLRPGLALHMGKILECGAIAATPGRGRRLRPGHPDPGLASSWRRSTPSASSPDESRPPTRSTRNPIPTICPARAASST